MYARKAHQMAGSLIEKIERAISQWESALENDPEAALAPTVEDLINALRGVDEDSVSTYEWCLAC